MQYYYYQAWAIFFCRCLHGPPQKNRGWRDKLVKQQAELQAFDEKLRHYAGQLIILDLDGGVKVNYGKFEELLAEVKAVTGKKWPRITLIARMVRP